MRKFSNDIERIQQNRYKPIILESGEITNTRQYRAAYAKAFVTLKGGEVDKRKDIARAVGCSMSSLSSVMDSAGIISLEKTAIKPFAQLTDYERDNLLLGQDGDNAIIRAPYGAKLAELAAPEEQAAYQNRRDRKRELYAMRERTKPDGRPAPKVTSAAPPMADVMRGYSDPFVLRQAAYSWPDYLVIEHGQITNTRTGETYTSTARNMIRALADDLRPPVVISEGVNMYTYTANTQPKEPPAPQVEREAEDRQPSAWQTPQPYLDAARAVMGGIDTVIDAHNSYDDDQVWQGRVWLRTPTGRGNTEKALARLFSLIGSGEVTEAVIMTNNHCTAQRWFQPLFDYLMCFSLGRVRLDGAPSAPTHGSVWVYIGENRIAFEREFSPFGHIAAQFTEEKADLPLWKLTGIREETARAHTCDICGQPAAGQNFVGEWRCEAHRHGYGLNVSPRPRASIGGELWNEVAR